MFSDKAIVQHILWQELGLSARMPFMIGLAICLNCTLMAFVPGRGDRGSVLILHSGTLARCSIGDDLEEQSLSWELAAGSWLIAACTNSAHAEILPPRSGLQALWQVVEEAACATGESFCRPRERVIRR